MEFRTFGDFAARPPTWAERARLAEIARAGIEDVYLDPEGAPPGFWENVLMATEWCLNVFDTDSEVWSEWAAEMRWAQGWPEFQDSASRVYQTILRSGLVYFRNEECEYVGTSGRLAAIEHLLDIVKHASVSVSDFEDRVNDRARWFKVGVQLENRRFTPVKSQHMHESVVRPTLLLLSDSRLAAVNSLYRKAFDRALANDPAGAVTAATSAVEELLRTGLDAKGLTLETLLAKAVTAGWLSRGLQQVVVKLAALRSDSDAHAVGTSSFEVAMFAVHIAGSVLLHLSRTGPFAKAQVATRVKV